MHDLDENILFFTRSMALGGTENVILQLCEIFKPVINKIIVCSNGGINEKKLKKLGIKHYKIPDIQNKDLSTIRTVLMTVNRIIKNEDITIVHTHHRMAAFYTTILSYSHRFRFFSTAHGVFEDKRFFTKFSYKRAKVIACGKEVRNNLVGYYKLDPSQVVVIHNSVKKDVSPKQVIPEIKKLRDLKMHILAYVGRMSKEKGIDILLNTIQMLKQDNEFSFVFVGSGPLEGQVKDMIYRNNLVNRVVFLGYRNDPQNVIRQVDAIVLPSYTEGFPLTPIEAFAQGKPVVSTAVGGSKEIVQDKFNGRLVKTGDAQMICDAIKWMFQDELRYQQLCKNAKFTFENSFSYDVFRKQMISFYKENCKVGK